MVKQFSNAVSEYLNLRVISHMVSEAVMVDFTLHPFLLCCVCFRD